MIVFSSNHFEPNYFSFSYVKSSHSLHVAPVVEFMCQEERQRMVSHLSDGDSKLLRKQMFGFLAASWDGTAGWSRDLFRHSTGFVPICSLGLSQIGRMNLGMDASTFKFYTMCGLQEGFEPFAVNMNRDVAMWFSKRLPTFVNVPKDHPHIEVTLYVVGGPGRAGGPGH